MVLGQRVCVCGGIELTGLVCVHNFVLWFFSYETETVLHTCTHSHTHTESEIYTYITNNNMSLKRRQLLLLFVLLAGIFTQLFYMLRLKKCWRLGLKEGWRRRHAMATLISISLTYYNRIVESEIM